MKELAERTAVVTGASSGIGLAMARAFADQGMNVVLADVRWHEIETAADAINAAGRVRAVAVQTDVSDHASVAGLAERAIGAFGKVHLLCANAGVVTHGATWEQSIDDWTWTLGVNLWGVVHCLRAFIPHMLGHNEPGHVVVTSSAAGLVSPTSSAYPASKFAILAIAEGMAEDLRDSRIGVTIVCPGGVRTQINASDRIRPAGLDQRGTISSEVAARIAAMADPGRTDQVAPEYIADLVIDAIRSGQRYVMPMQPHFKDAIRRRLHQIEAGLQIAPDILG